MICDAQRGTVEYVVEERSQESLEAYYHQFTTEELAQQGLEDLAAHPAHTPNPADRPRLGRPPLPPRG